MNREEKINVINEKAKEIINLRERIDKYEIKLENTNYHNAKSYEEEIKDLNKDYRNEKNKLNNLITELLTE